MPTRCSRRLSGPAQPHKAIRLNAPSRTINAGSHRPCTKNHNIKVFEISPDIRKMIDYIFIDLRAVSRSTITIFNWTHGLDSPLDPCPSVRSRASYSEDGTRWFQYSEARRIVGDPLSVTHMIYARNAQIDEVVRKVEAGVEEPLGRQLFREAWSQVGTNPRSALVIGVTAAEVGLKRLIATLVPGTDWLMEEIPTPPVGKILWQRRREIASAGRSKNTLRAEVEGCASVGGSQPQLSSSISEPAFPSRPGITSGTARSVGDERSGATRSSASPSML
jgi:hypothetical protein